MQVMKRDRDTATATRMKFMLWSPSILDWKAIQSQMKHFRKSRSNANRYYESAAQECIHAAQKELHHYVTIR